MIETVNLDTGLTDAQTAAARYLVEGVKAVDVAEILEVDESTISRWRRKPQFVALMASIAADANRELVGRMVELTHKALDVLDEALDYRHDPNIKLRAAIAIINASGVTRMSRTAASASSTEAIETGTEG